MESSNSNFTVEIKSNNNKYLCFGNIDLCDLTTLFKKRCLIIIIIIINFQSVRTTASKHPIDYKRKFLGIKRMVKQLVFVCIKYLLYECTYLHYCLVISVRFSLYAT